MKRKIYFLKNSIPLIALFMLCSANAQTSVIFSNDTDLLIPDNSTLVSTPIIVSGVPNDAHIYHMNVGIRADHTWVGDLTFSLQMPNGASMGLMHRPGTDDVLAGFGGNSANLISNNMILFEDYSPTSSEEIGYNLGEDDIIPAGAFKPSWNTNETNPEFISFTDIAADYAGPKTGPWLLYVTDKMAGDTGTLTYAEILIEYDNYCVPFFDNDYEHISNVSFAGLDYTSADFNLYHPDYQTVALTDDSYPVTQGETYPLSVAIDPDEDDYIYAFIDWNQDKDFDDFGEKYTVASAVSTAGPHTLNITIPEGATLGETRMRIAVEYNNPTPNACAVTFGEVEDFTLLVEENMGVNDLMASNKTTAYPNPVMDVVNFTSKNNIAQINIYNANGQEVFAQKANSKEAELNISNLPSSVYVAKIKTDKGTETIKLIKK